MNFSIILWAVIAFLVVTLVLVALLLFAKAKLTSSGAVKININDGDKVLEVESGSTLLSTLSEQGIFLPSACGGKGACGQCKCQVVSGGGEILPTERGFFNRRQINEGWRLGCQVKVKEDIAIKVPASVLSIKKWECEVVSNHNVATFIKEFVVKLPEGEHLNFRSGGYIQIDVPAITVDYKDIDVDPEYREDWVYSTSRWLTQSLRFVHTHVQHIQLRVISSSLMFVLQHLHLTVLRTIGYLLIQVYVHHISTL